MTAPDTSRAAVAPLLVLAVGNPSRGDDALGPMLLEALHAEGIDGDGQVELLGDFQLQIEHVIDLRGRRAVLFVDAARPGAVGRQDGAGRTQTRGPAATGADAEAVGAPRDGDAASPALALARLTPAPALPVLSHALEPAAVLHVAQRLGERVPPAWQLAIEGEAFELGAGLSAAARARLPLALAQARQWVAAHGARSSATRGATPHA